MPFMIPFKTLYYFSCSALCFQLILLPALFSSATSRQPRESLQSRRTGKTPTITYSGPLVPTQPTAYSGPIPYSGPIGSSSGVAYSGPIGASSSGIAHSGPIYPTTTGASSSHSGPLSGRPPRSSHTRTFSYSGRTTRNPQRTTTAPVSRAEPAYSGPLHNRSQSADVLNLQTFIDSSIG